jgi:hypothetical protein
VSRVVGSMTSFPFAYHNPLAWHNACNIAWIAEA